MEENGRIIKLLSEMLIEQKGIKEELIGINQQQIITNSRLEKLEKLEKQQAKTNLAIGELRLSVMKLADRLEVIADHEKRIDKLEHTVYH